MKSLKPSSRVALVKAVSDGSARESTMSPKRSEDVPCGSVLDALDIAKALFWGYSMGGWIGFGIAKYTKERIHALVIGGQQLSSVPRSFGD
jgi:hypothetical protein